MQKGSDCKQISAETFNTLYCPCGLWNACKSSGAVPCGYGSKYLGIFIYPKNGRSNIKHGQFWGPVVTSSLLSKILSSWGYMEMVPLLTGTPRSIIAWQTASAAGAKPSLPHWPWIFWLNERKKLLPNPKESLLSHLNQLVTWKSRKNYRAYPGAPENAL